MAKSPSPKPSHDAAQGQDSSSNSNAKKRENESPQSDVKQARQKTEANGNGSNQEAPSTVLERGIIYYFIRARVNIEAPKSVSDIARGFLILRPIPPDKKLGQGPLSASATSRLIALPKKMLPGGSSDKFMAFVEKADVSYENLRDEFLKGEEYETKTLGHRQRPDAAPVGEGVYVITSTGRESHLSYIATVPKEMGALQKALRFGERGSFIISSKNPKVESPENARLPDGPDYPESLMEKFGALRWAPTEPELLDYAQAQFLLIGDKTDLAKDVEEGKVDGSDEDDPVGVLQELESQDVDRMKHLSTNEADAIYEDLKCQALSHPDIQKEL